MFATSLQDRLNAAVKSLETTGSQLQARALSVNANNNSTNNVSSPKESPSRSASPSIAKSPVPSTSPLASTSTEKKTDNVSPTKTTGGSIAAGSYVGSTAHLAENALSGLRKSFHFGNRSSQDLSNKSPTIPTAITAQQELKDIASPSASPSLAGPASSRPSSPNPRLLPTSTFTLGSDPPSRAITPTPAGRRGSKLALEPVTPLPPPDPSDPATYPLPPSPTLSASNNLTTPSTGFADPLGASPIIDACADQEVPKLGLHEATPDTERKEGVVGLGVDGVDTETVEVQITPIVEGQDGDVEKPVIELSGEEIKKLADSERRYEDLSQRFTTLLTQTHKANQVLKDLTPLEGGIADHEALEGWVRMVNGKVDMITAEMKRLQDKLTLQDSRMEELRDTHRLEGSSQADLITKLRGELSEAQEQLKTSSTDNTTLNQLKADLSKAQTQAKEEEEKRTKAISLLKTVRLKLVKVEKEKEEIEKDRAEERAERARASEEVERIKGEKEREVTTLRKGFERELASQKERYEKDMSTKKANWELEMITTKASHAKELSAKTTKVNGLEAIVKELNLNKQRTFEDLQAKQAEAESAKSEMELMSTRTKELEFQLREANERVALLEDASNNRSMLGLPNGFGGSPAGSPMGSRRNSTSMSNKNGSGGVDIQKLLSEAEAKSESKLSDLRFKIKSLEIERNDIEEEWSVKLQERVRELEKLRRQIQEKDMEVNDTMRGLQERESRIQDGEERVRSLEKELVKLRGRLEQGKGDIQIAVEAERSAKDEISSLQTQLHALQTQLEESKNHITQVKGTNKTLREEMRKLQSSVQLMERQRNPGVGYWSGTAQNTVNSRSGVPSPAPAPVSVDSPAQSERRVSLESVSTRTGGGPGTPSVGGTPTISSGSPAGEVKKQDEEEVNLEYLRNVILQFLEHKEMRPNLIRVMSVILRFTPQELRRLNAKLQS
ncbi:hypothetical protein I302_106850 [Kwoniella bestiolae CBS 10118]|uniref:GRIP domain-containing protein n=1 Tax=Kwoniella bestiolae CBS 10118 TaxID=1296100 RepID=A0A1B9G085_9TREE|nr:hypothetical protein I302_05885 [Kwoniella bestiolae CBS 10118]OCF24425.1 hypothetical protein I302_05885 [Kwoniella bestiolae CBS 10118]